MRARINRAVVFKQQTKLLLNGIGNIRADCLKKRKAKEQYVLCMSKRSLNSNKIYSPSHRSNFAFSSSDYMLSFVDGLMFIKNLVF